MSSEAMPQTAEGTTADDTPQNPGRVPHLPRRASASKARLRPRGPGRGLRRACASGPQVHQYIPVRFSALLASGPACRPNAKGHRDPPLVHVQRKLVSSSLEWSHIGV